MRKTTSYTFIILSLLLGLEGFINKSNYLYAQDDDDINMSPYVTKYFLIGASTKNFDVALRKAKDISKKLNITFNSRDLYKIEGEEGLSFAKDICEDHFDYPCYTPRGRYDDGDYVSIEWSNAYDNFSKGYYVVMLSSQSDKSPDLLSLLKRTKSYIPTAYIKASEVYMGCMH